MTPYLQDGIAVDMLGQSGLRLGLPGTVVYVDPYLSNSVQELDAPDLKRQMPIALSPESVSDASWVLVTHEHMDHCDPHTLPQLAKASPQAQFMGPAPVLAILEGWGIDRDRLHLAHEYWQSIDEDLSIMAIPAAHLDAERDSSGNLRYVGFLLTFQGNKIYIAGDTVVTDELLAALSAQLPIHTAFLPVNEHNYFKNRRGIIGNMSAREAFQLAEELQVKQVVALHWDMFAVNAVSPAEIRLVHKTMQASFDLLIQPKLLRFDPISVSVIIRTLNEEEHLDALLSAIEKQSLNGVGIEVVIVDSGSNDATLEIAAKHNCRIVHISRDEFSFGRSLNVGCQAAKGEYLVFTSGHCIPVYESWLQRLCQPIIDGKAEYVYGRQVGNHDSRFSETRIFAKYFPDFSVIPKDGIYCNNANAALSKVSWQQYHFDESLTGLEDMALAKKLVNSGAKLAYVADASVFHLHHENWEQVKRRFEREAIALQEIMPQVHVSLLDTIRYIFISTMGDLNQARKEGFLFSRWLEILKYRYYQYRGSYEGNRRHRKLSRQEKDHYFFPY